MQERLPREIGTANLLHRAAEALMRFAGRTKLGHPGAIWCVGIISCAKPIVCGERSEGESGGSH